MTTATATTRASRTTAKTRTLSFAANVVFSRHVVTITETRGSKTETKRYWLTEFTADGGKGFHWSTFADDCRHDEDGQYDVFVSDDPTTEPNSCCCKGHLQHGHKTVCRHIAACLTLLERDLI